MRNLHLECKPDEVLAKMLGKTRKAITHHNDKGRVCRYLTQNKGVTGMIDEDPSSAQPSYLSTLTHKATVHNIKELNDPRLQNKMLVVCPRLEDWIIDVCRRNDVDITGFGLSNRPNTLHREINTKLNNFERLLTHLLDEIKSEELLHLRSLLQ